MTRVNPLPNIPCPIAGCKKKAYTLNGIYTHLYQDHRKSEVINCLIEKLKCYSYWVRQIDQRALSQWSHRR